MNYTNKQHSNYLNQSEGPILASDGLIERVSDSAGVLTVRSADQLITGRLVSFTTVLNTGIVKVVVRPPQVPTPVELMKIQGKCEVEFSGSALPGMVVSTSSNFDESTFELSFMPDGDT